MTTEPQNHEPQTRPVFKFLAGFFGILFSIAGIAAVIFAFQSSGAALTRSGSPEHLWVVMLLIGG